ncbi:O-antigen ligase family protein [Pseudophaeobacter arcticus]|nr:O-antigen ligase family protein [Pseudophaeobacter arcticus]
MIKPGLLGNFDANLSLFPFLVLAMLLLLDRSILNVLQRHGPEGALVRMIAILFVIAGGMTVFHGAFLSAVGASAYDTNPLRKSIVTSIVPIFLILLICTAVVIGEKMSPRALQRSIELAFGAFFAYTLLQVASSIVANPFYSSLWPVFEGSRDNLGVSYIERFGRINGTTMEPSEFSKLLCILFLPWFVYPVEGSMLLKRVLLVLALGMASMALTGIFLVIVAFFLITLSNRVKGWKRRMLIVIGLVAMVSLIVAGDVLFAQILSRLTALNADPSAIIRFFYNYTAAQIVLENPIFGIGWSNEIYYFPQRVVEISFLWEVRNDLLTGNALTAKSLFLRLSMYLGIPLMIVLILTIMMSLRKTRGVLPDRDVARARMTFVLLGTSAIIDGGIITSFYMWCAPGLCLGVLMRQRRIRERIAQTQRRVQAVISPEPVK